MSTRLLNAHREAIVRTVLARRFEAEEKEIEAREHAIAAQVHKDMLGPKLHKLFEQCPPEWFEKQDAIRVEFGGKVVSVSFAESMPMPANKACWRAIAGVYESGHPLTELHAAVAAAESVLIEKRNGIERELRATLDVYHTLEKLIEAWPEIESFAVAAVNPPPKAIAVPRKKLNAELGLPP